MLFNSSSTASTSFSNNNNNPNQANPNNQTNIFSASPNLPNSSLGNMPPQLPTVFGSAPGGGLLGNPQPSGGLFGNQIQQQSQTGGGLFSNQVQQQPPTRGLFGGPQPPNGGMFGAQAQRQSRQESLDDFFGISRDSKDAGTVGLIGMYHSGNYPRNIDNFALPSITNRPRFRGQTLDEIRMKDYFNLKNNTLDSNQRRTVRCAIYSNLTQINSDIHSHFSSTGLPPNLKTLFSDTSLHDNSTRPVLASGPLFMNPQPSQIIPSPMVINIPTNQPSGLQSSSLPTQTIKLSKEPTVTQPPETKESSTKAVKPTTTAAKFENKILTLSSSGSFGYEFNKMLFVSTLVQIMEKHHMSMPENLLDNTDFVSQLLAFLEQHNIHLPTENIPQFQIDSITQSLPDDETSE